MTTPEFSAVVKPFAAAIINEWRLTVHSEGRMLVSVAMDGTVSYAPNLTLDEAKLAISHLIDALAKATKPCSPG